jgi:hypothetical protein
MRKGVPDAVVREAHRLESFFFDGYDRYFEGDEPVVGELLFRLPPGMPHCCILSSG